MLSNGCNSIEHAMHHLIPRGDDLIHRAQAHREQGRRAGLSKKVKELSLLCGAELALIVFSPACNPFSPSTTPRSTPSSAASSPAAPCLLLRSIAAICCCRPS
ncbi:unnamed protein product, partial [Musa banksii]